MSDKKIYDTSLLTALEQNLILTAKDRKKNGSANNVAGSRDGLYNTVVPEPRRNFIVAGNNLLLTDSSKNSGIVIGSDRPASRASGYGGKGAMGANTIDIVVGRMASQSKLPSGTNVDNSFSGDAARIYISQLTDIDLNFGLEAGFGGMSTARSAIGIKADAVRVIGREGVKIISGRSFAFEGHGSGGETNTHGGKISQNAPPIELIAGNTKSEAGFAGIGPQVRVLQGVAKGENVRDGLRELSAIIDEMLSAMFHMCFNNIMFFSAMGINIWHPHYATATGFTVQRYMTDVFNPLWHTRANKAVWNVNFTMPFGEKYVVSKNVYAT